MTNVDLTTLQKDKNNESYARNKIRETTQTAPAEKIEMAHLTNKFRHLKVIGTVTKVFAGLLLLAGLVLPYDLSHLHSSVEQETDCLYCQIEQSPGSDAGPIALSGPVALTAIGTQARTLADLPTTSPKQHRQRAPPATFS